MKASILYWLEMAAWSAGIAGLAALFFWLAPTGEIVLLDKSREGAEHADFVIDFLDTIDARYRFDHGFVALAKNQATETTLFDLTAALRSAIDLVAQRRQEGKPAPRLMLVPDEKGKVRVSVDPANEPADSRDAVESLNELRRQYDAVVAALRHLRPDAIGMVHSARITSITVHKPTSRSHVPPTASPPSEYIELTELKDETVR